MQNGCGGVQRVLFTAKELRERMKNPVDILFLDHPRSVGETYLQHQRFALRVSGQLMMTTAGAMIHAVVPKLCETSASRRIRSLYQLVQPRN